MADALARLQLLAVLVGVPLLIVAACCLIPARTNRSDEES